MWTVREHVHETDIGVIRLFSIEHPGHYRPFLSCTGDVDYDRRRFDAIAVFINLWEAQHRRDDQ